MLTATEATLQMWLLQSEVHFYSPLVKVIQGIGESLDSLGLGN